MAHNYDTSGEVLANPLPGDEVVITGIAGRFPQSNNVDDFFANIMDKKDLLSQIPKEWVVLCQQIPRRIGTVNEKEKFDAGYFGLNYYEAEDLNPTHRQLLECTVEAIIDSGLHPSDLKGTKTGVYLGLLFIDFEIPWLHYNLSVPKFGVAGSLRSTLPQLIAHHLGLEGPTICIDSACSTSGYALDHAYRAIRSGKCENAIVGCANFILAHHALNLALRLGILDPQAENKIFNENSGGYVRSDAVSVVFLQKTKNSKRIYAQILHSKTNADGYKADGILHPSGKLQATLIREVYQEAGVNVSDINYLESHSTGTKAGDPQEIGAITDVFCQNRMVPFTVGSVKSNMGHTESASGLCSLIKVAMAMQTGWMPPMICTNVRNDIAGFRDGKIHVATEPFDIQNEDIIGINNFGYGGANSHTLVKRVQQGVTEWPSQVNLVCAHARTSEGLAQLLASIVLKCHDKGYTALLQNIFRNDMDTCHYRGFAIVSNDKVVHKSCGKRLHLKPRLGLSFGGAVESCTERFDGIPIFSQILGRVESCWDLSGWYEKSLHMQSIVMQIALVELLDFLELPIEFVQSSSTGVIAGAYAEKLITLEQSLSIACQYLGFSNGPNGKLYTSHSPAMNKTKALLKCRVEENEITNIALASFILGSGNVMNVTDTDSLLMSLGRLYEVGFNPNISKLYSVCHLPVKAPTISPWLRWHHDEDWFIPKAICHAKHGTETVSISLDSVDVYWKFLMGHVVDDRNLLPATALIYIALETFLKREGLLLSDAKVLFERIKLHRALILPKTGNIVLTTQIFKQSNGFEITHGNELLVSGYLRLPQRSCDHAIECAPMTTSIEQPLTLSSIYKQLNLQQYNYRDQFRGLLQVDTGATQALIKWNNNWITFIDHIISMVLLKKNCKDLVLPTFIDRLVIDAQRHSGTSEMIYSGPHCNIIKSSGVEIRGLQLTSISKRAPVGEPLLQDYKFVPYSGIFSENASLRTCLRVVADNTRASVVRVVELVENRDNLLSLTLSNLFTEFSVQHKIAVYSSLELELPNIIVENKKIDFIGKNTNLVVLTDVSQKMLHQLPEQLQEGAFILVRQPPDYCIEAIKQVDVILTHKSEKGLVFLLRRRVTYKKPRVVSVSDDLNWISELQTSIIGNERVLLLSAGRPANGVLGLMNTLKLEDAKCQISCVVLMDRDAKFDLEGQFFREQLEKSLLVNILRDGKWGAYVYFRKESKNVKEFEEVVGITDVGNFYWRQGPPYQEAQIPSDHTLAYVYYTGLNFKDASLSSGKNRLNPFSLGFEFSGKNPSGERVMATVREAALASLVTSDNDLSWKIPDEWSLEDGATVPAAYCTVVYALIIIAKIKAGQTVLIHVEDGGVEQAAINVAAYYNCTIYLTANSMRRRNVLKRLYPSLQGRFIGISLDSTFEQQIMTETEGKGVDVIVNSFPGEQLYAGLRLLSQGGKFLDLGQRDVANESVLDIGSIVGNRSFFGVNLDDIFGATTWRKKQLQHALYEGIRLKYIKPLSRRVYGSDSVKDALTYMTTGKHSVKVIVKLRDEKQNMYDPLTMPAKPRFYCNSEKVYVLVGGLGGFGLQLADWLVTRGARKLIFVTRNGATTDYQTYKIRYWEEDGVHVVVSQCNLATIEGCCKLFKKANVMGSVDGIFNLAIVLSDGLFENQTKETFAPVLIPKFVVTQNLDVASRVHCPNLRCFVVFSSIICGKGNIGQSNYGMANSAMEEICVMRKNEGYPGLAIQWGMIGDVGQLEEHDDKLNALVTVAGSVKQKIASCLQVLDELLDSDEAIVSSSVLANTSDSQSNEDDLLGGIASLLGLNLQHISLHSSLSQIGMDSITSVEIKQFLERNFEISKGVRELMNITLSQLKEEQMGKKV